MMKIALTGGHLTPALATIEALRRIDSKIEFVWLGRKYAQEGDPEFSVEYNLVPTLDIKFIELTAGRLQRRFTRYTIPSLFKLPRGFWESFFILKKERPDVLLSFGGYLSFPVVFSAWTLSIPTITHEQSVAPGLANKLNAFFAKKVAISWKETQIYFPENKTVLTGNPLRSAVFSFEKTFSKNSLLNNLLELAGKEKKKIIYITGGNQGSHFLNQTVAEILPDLVKRYFLIIQTGKSKLRKDFEKLQSSVKLFHLEDRVFITQYVKSGEIGFVFKVSDLLISRAGANIVTEILALGKPAILIPLPWAAGQEQMRNARLVEDCDLGIILDQMELTPQRLLSEILMFEKNLSRFQKNAKLSKQLLKKDSAELLARETLSLGGNLDEKD